MKVKVCDFNVARRFEGETMMCKTGLDQWNAPEALACSIYTEKVDEWGLGCLMYFMLTGCPPFDCSDLD